MRAKKDIKDILEGIVYGVAISSGRLQPQRRWKHPTMLCFMELCRCLAVVRQRPDIANRIEADIARLEDGAKRGQFLSWTDRKKWIAGKLL